MFWYYQNLRDTFLDFSEINGVKLAQIPSSSWTQGSARAVPRYPSKFWKLWVPKGTGYQLEKNFWVPMGTGYRPEKKFWVPMGTGYRPEKNFWVPMGTGYRPEKNLWVPMGTGYRLEKKFWVPMGTGYQENFHLCRPLI